VNIYGPSGCGKTHLINILKGKINCIIIVANKINTKTLDQYKIKECLIVDNFKNNIDEKLLYSIINMALQDNKYLIISSLIALKNFKIELKDLSSRFTSFVDIGIDLPTDDLLRVILKKNFSDKQIRISEKNIEYILKNIDRSYERVNTFSSFIDNLSLSKAEPINLQLIKKVLDKLSL
jgi:chromosomal replication initiation ATPase DnaA